MGYNNVCGCPKNNGDPCGKPAGWGTSHVGSGFCRLHDNKALDKAASAEAKAIVAKFGGRMDVHPAQALLELVQNKAAEVEYWRVRATEAESWKDLADVGVGGQVYKKVTLAMLHEAEDQLAKFSQACVKVGVAEVRVRAMAVQGQAIVEAMRTLLQDPRLGVLTSAPVDDVIRETLQKLAADASATNAIAKWSK